MFSSLDIAYVIRGFFVSGNIESELYSSWQHSNEFGRIGMASTKKEAIKASFWVCYSLINRIHRKSIAFIVNKSHQPTELTID